MSYINRVKENIDNIIQTRHQETTQEYKEKIEDILSDDTLIKLWIHVFWNEEQFAWWLLTDNIFFWWQPLLQSVQEITEGLKTIDYSHLL